MAGLCDIGYFGDVFARRLGLMVKPQRKISITAMLACGVAVGASAHAASVVPTGGNFAAGTGTITSVTNGVTVDQSSASGVINWTSFSIGQGQTVQINNGSGATLNRVTGNKISQIAGQLKATGTVYLINPNGILVTPTGKITTTGSFVASTRDISNSAFMAGGAPEFKGTSSGTAVNQGSITSANGDVVLIGSANTNNSGIINAPNGTAGLASGNDVVIQAPGSTKRILVKSGGGDVTNTGTLAGAQAELNAASGNVYALAGNNGGIVHATGTATINGIVYITGASFTVGGTVEATTKNGSTSKVMVSSHKIVIQKGGRVIGSVVQSN